MSRVFETDITLNAQRELRLADADSSAYVGFKAPSTITTNRIWTLPAADGTSGQVLSTNGSGTLSWATAGGGGGLTHFVESESTAAPNATVPVDALTATDASFANIDVALVAKGFGATSAQVSDNTTANGNKRGQRATDFQKERGIASQVASGPGAGILAGQSNQASGFYCSVVGGASNTASTNYSFVGGGQSNTAQTNTHATVSGGMDNVAAGPYSFIGGGFTNATSGTYSCAFGGNSNSATGQASSVVGGEFNTANSACSTVLGGRRGTTRSIQGYCVFPSNNSPIASANGVTQAALLVLGRETTSNAATVLASDSSAASATNQVILPNNAAYYFRGSVIAGVTAGGSSKAWTFEGVIKRGANAASTAIVGTVVLNTIAQDAGASSWAVAITADTTNGGIAVTVTGATSTTIRWVAKIETVEMTY